jgi:hypothetical protein
VLANISLAGADSNKTLGVLNSYLVLTVDYLFETNGIETPPSIYAVSRATLTLSRALAQLIKHKEALTGE